jgi:hypothetical protein
MEALAAGSAVSASSARFEKRMRSMKRFLLAFVLAAAVLGLLAAPALADRAYHSQHITLMSADGAPLKAGFVENIHVNGPEVFALERYVLVGAMPLTQYQARIQIYLDPEMDQHFGALPTASFATNGVGNGVGHFTLPPSGVPPAFHGVTLYLVWELCVDSEVVYESSLSTVILD